MRKIDHENIVKLVDFSESRQYYYIILELCPGGELFHQIVRLTYFSEDLSRHVIIQVAKALEYLHEDAGVVHRYGWLEPFPFVKATNEDILVTLSPRICYSTPYRSFRHETPSLRVQKTRIRLTRESLSKTSVLAVLAR